MPQYCHHCQYNDLFLLYIISSIIFDSAWNALSSPKHILGLLSLWILNLILTKNHVFTSQTGL